MSIAAITISSRRIAARAFQLQYGYTPERPTISKLVGRYPIGGTTNSYIDLGIPDTPNFISPISGDIKDSSLSQYFTFALHVPDEYVPSLYKYYVRLTLRRNGVLVSDVRKVSNFMGNFFYSQIIAGSPAGEATLEAYAINEYGESSLASPKVNITII